MNTIRERINEGIAQIHQEMEGEIQKTIKEAEEIIEELTSNEKDDILS